MFKMDIDRRTLLGAVAIMAAARPARAQSPPDSVAKVGPATRRSRTGNGQCGSCAPWLRPTASMRARIGLIGFSAGGHLAGTLAVSSAQTFYPPLDAVDALSRPNFCGLMYPVLSMMLPFDNTDSIIGMHPSAAESEAYSVERHVGKDTPPMFLAQAADDPVSAVDNSLMMFSALRTAGIPAEMHIFQTDGHGWGLGRPGSEVHAWPELFMRWAAQYSPIPPVRDDR
jgi:acetyl esterase/lipase